MNDKRVLFVCVTDISGPKGRMLKMVLMLQLTYFKLSHYKCGSGQQLPFLHDPRADYCMVLFLRHL